MPRRVAAPPCVDASLSVTHGGTGCFPVSGPKPLCQFGPCKRWIYSAILLTGHRKLESPNAAPCRLHAYRASNSACFATGTPEMIAEALASDKKKEPTTRQCFMISILQGYIINQPRMQVALHDNQNCKARPLTQQPRPMASVPTCCHVVHTLNHCPHDHTASPTHVTALATACPTASTQPVTPSSRPRCREWHTHTHACIAVATGGCVIYGTVSEYSGSAFTHVPTVRHDGRFSCILRSRATLNGHLSPHSGLATIHMYHKAHQKVSK